MPDEPNSITTMRRHYLSRTTMPNAEHLATELMEGNDRSSVVTLAALLDGVLEWVLINRLPGLNGASETVIDAAFRNEGPLGAFSGKIDMAFYLGAIDQTVRDQLHVIRHMRNSCAHTRLRVSFADTQLANVAKRVFHPTGHFKLYDDTPEGFRKTLVAEGLLLFNILVFGQDVAIKMMGDAYSAAGMAAPF